MSEHGYCDKCGEDLGDHPTVNVEGINTLALCQDRAIKWQRVEPGHVIPAGQPYRVEYPEMLPECLASDQHGILAVDYDGMNLPFKPFQHSNFVETSRWFVDSSWKPPLGLPTAPGSVVEAGSGGYGPDLWMLTDSARWVSEDGRFARPENMTILRVLFDAGVTR